jgi:hypothetical protein
MPENLPARTAEMALRYPIFDPQTFEELKEILNANLGPRGLSQKKLPRIKWPSGGQLAFMVETLEGDDHPVKELTGFLVGWCDKRMYYRVPYAERGKKIGPPECSSTDGYWGEGDPGGDCDRCPLAKYGSDPKGGRGQACKQIKQVLLLREGHTFPDVVNIPPTSIANLEKYLLRLGNYRVPYWGLITTIRLERVQNPDGVDYARALFTAGERLSAEERKQLEPYAVQMMALLKPMTVEAEDYYVDLAEQPAEPEPEPRPDSEGATF